MKNIKKISIFGFAIVSAFLMLSMISIAQPINASVQMELIDKEYDSGTLNMVSSGSCDGEPDFIILSIIAIIIGILIELGFWILCNSMDALLNFCGSIRDIVIKICDISVTLFWIAVGILGSILFGGGSTSSTSSTTSKTESTQQTAVRMV